MKRLVSLCLVLSLLAIAGITSADQPILLSHQGRLLDASDAPVANGAYAARFSLWTDSTMGNEVWFEIQDINVQKGLFSTFLGRSTNLLPVLDQYANQPLFLQTQVTISGNAVVLSPRLRIGTVPVAAHALRLSSDTVSGTGHSVFTNSTQGGSTEMKVISLNGLPPGTPVTGLKLSSTNDSAIVDASTYDNGVLKSEYTAKTGKTGATKRLVFVSGSVGSASDVSVDADSAAFSSSVSKFGELKGLVGGSTTVVGTSGTSSRLAIKTKGTGAQRSTITLDATDDGATSSSAAFRAINTTGTGATVRAMASASGDSASSVLDIDTDGNGSIDRAITHYCGPDSVVVEQSYKTSSADIHYKAKQGTSGSTKRTTSQSGSSSSSTDELTAADSIVHADSLFDNGQPKATYKATQGKTGKAKQSLFYDNGDESESSERSTVDSSVVDETYHHNNALQAQYTAKTGKTGSTKSAKITDDEGDESSSSERSTADSTVTDETYHHGPALQAQYTAKTGKTGKTKRMMSQSGSDQTVSAESQDADLIVYADSATDGGTQSSAYKATHGKTGKTKRMMSQSGSDQTVSSESQDADSIVQSDSSLSNGDLKTEYTARQGSSGRTKRTMSQSGGDQTVSSETVDADSIVQSDSSLSNNDIKTTYIARQGSSGRTKRTIHNTGTTSYASNEEVDNNGARLYLTSDDNSGTPPDTAFYVDNSGNLRLSGNGTYGISLTGSGARLGIGVQTPAHPLELASGAHCTAGGVFTNASDVNLKENFKPVNEEAILDKVEQLPITQWNYKNEGDDVTHIGPTAQDFKAIFGVGDNDKTISTIDPAGIALAAIKELRKENRDLKSENAELKKRLDDLQKLVEGLASKK